MNTTFWSDYLNSNRMTNFSTHPDNSTHLNQGIKHVWWLLKLKKGGIIRPDIYMHEDYNKVQEKHFENCC